MPSCITRMKINHHCATEQSLGKAIQHFCALLPELHWFAPQIKYSAQKSTWNCDVFNLSALIRRIWRREKKKKKERTFCLIPLQLTTVYNMSSLGTPPLHLGHSEYWEVFFYFIHSLLSKKHGNLEMRRSCYYVKNDSLIKLQLAPLFSDIQAQVLTWGGKVRISEPIKPFTLLWWL